MLDDIRVVDEFQNVYHSAGLIGRGGQGVVLRTRDSDIALKLLVDKNDQLLSGATELEAARARLQRLRTLPLPPGLPLAGPVAALRERCGYVMRLLETMRSFKDSFQQPPPAVIAALPAWLAQVAEDDAEAAWQLADYAATGSTRTRLLLLAKCGGALARLHAAGLVYGDISSANVFAAGVADEVWLIDADNVRYEEQVQGEPTLFTPGYGAPELVRGDAPVSFHTDCHAFAVLAFSLLSLNFPFEGDLVKNGGDWAADEAGDPRQQAQNGELPWVHDEEDSSNVTCSGLPLELICSAPLARLFHATFGAGRKTPSRRPAIWHWPQALAAAADQSLGCGGCGMSYYALQHSCCPYCSKPRETLLLLESHRWCGTQDGGATAPCWTLMAPLNQFADGYQLPARLFLPFHLASHDEAMLSLHSEEQGYRLRRLGRQPLRIACAGLNDGAFETLENFHLSAAQLAGGAIIFVPGPQARRVSLTLLEAA